MDFILSIGHFLGKTFLVPLLAYAQLRKLRPFTPLILENIRQALHVSQTQALTIYRRGVASFFALSVEFFFTARHNQRTLQRKLDATKVIGAEQLAAVFASSRPILIITMYMGNFPLGFLKLLTSIKSQRKLFVFKFNAKSVKEDLLFTLFRRASQNIEPLRAGEEGGKRAFLELRKGNVVALMVDAEVHVTSRVSVTFFNKKCPMQSGPATLAALTKAVIVPIVNYTDSSNQSVVRVESPLYADKLSSEESNEQVITRLTQDIALLMESWIQIDPSQVQRWPSIAQIISRSEPIHREEPSSMRLATPNDISWMLKQHGNRSDSSFVVLSSIHGYSESELKAVFLGIAATYVMNSSDGSLILSVHDIDTEHGQARIQLCADGLNVPPDIFLQHLIETHGC